MARSAPRTRAVSMLAAAALSATCLVTVASTASAAGPIELEAEDAQLSGGAGVNANHPGYSGTGFVDGFVIDNTGTAALTFTLDVPAAGDYGLNIRYANGLGSDMTISQVAAGEDRQITLPSAVGASWSTWFVHQELVHLDAGQQQVVYRFDADDTGNVNIDAISLTTPGDLATPGGGASEPGSDPGSGPDTRWDGVSNAVATTKGRTGTAFQAEDAFVANGATASADAVDLSAERARLAVAVDASTDGTQTVTLRYRNDTGAATSLVLGVDGSPVGRLTLPATHGWADVGIPLTLHQGIGSIELRRTGDQAPATVAVDRLVLQHGTAMAARGATTATTSYEAEHGTTNGTVLAPSRTFHDLAAEASGRQAVTLTKRGDEVSWILTAPTSSLVLRASIPDSADGAGQAGSLGVYAGSKKVATIDVSSVYSHVYGGYPYGNDPSTGGEQRYFDESRVRLPRLPAGTRLRLVKDAGSKDLPYTVDLVETELVAAARTAPAGFLDVTDFGATANNASDDAAAFEATIAAAQAAGTGVWVPTGRFVLGHRLNVNAVTIRGAGPWYSVVAGRDGKGGFYATGSGVTIADLMIDGDVRVRDDAKADSGLEGTFGQGSLVQNVWIEHTKVGLWADPGTNGLYVLGLRVRDTFADGVHLNGLVTDTRVEHSVVRNTGDDAMAMWSSGGAVTRGVFAHDTVQVPLLGNGAAIYGGDSNRIEDTIVSDTLTAAAGIAVSTRFNPVPFSVPFHSIPFHSIPFHSIPFHSIPFHSIPFHSIPFPPPYLIGATVVSGNTLNRTGGWEPNWNTSFGAIWVFADTGHITTPVVISDTQLIDSTYEGLLVSGSHWVNDLRVSDTTIAGTGSYGIASRVGGDLRLTDVRASDVATQDDGQYQFWGTVIDGGGNDGVLEPAPATCSVRYRVHAVGRSAFVADVTLTNTGTATLSGWELAWHLAPGDAVTPGLGAVIDQDGSRVTASNVSWNATVRPGKSVTFGFLGATHGDAAKAPTTATLDGLPCTVS